MLTFNKVLKMSQYDEINSISNKDKQDIIEGYHQLMLESPDDDYQACVSSMIQHFHMLTGHKVSLADVSWYVSDWRGY